jgi:hypothetical protein
MIAYLAQRLIGHHDAMGCYFHCAVAEETLLVQPPGGWCDFLHLQSCMLHSLFLQVL